MTTRTKKTAAAATVAPKAKRVRKPVQTTIVVTTQPLRKALQPRTVEIAKGEKVNRHYNDDGSVTLYAAGLKIFRTASDKDMENGQVAEDYDADEAIDKFLKKWFGSKPWVFGKTTHGHRWIKKAKPEAEAPAAAAEAPAKAKRVRKPRAAKKS